MSIKTVICCVGHITIDEIITPHGRTILPGGTAYYFSHAIANLEVPYLLVTALANSELSILTELEERNIQVKRLPSVHTVFFQNSYGQDADHRSQKVKSLADPFCTNDLNDVEASVFHLGPLLAGDIPSEIISQLYKKGKVSLDVQGLLRKVENEQVIPIDWEAKKELLPFIHFIKASEEELMVLTNAASIEEGAKMLSAWGAKEVIITLGSKGSVIYTENKFHHVPAILPTKTVDATGCGDTYMAGYLSQRVKGLAINEAGLFAAAMASLKIATTGAFKGTVNEIHLALKNSLPTKA